MIVSGTVVGVKDGSYQSKRDGKQVALLNVDIYDKTCGVVPCQIFGAKVLPPEEGSRIVADVTGIRKSPIGVGYQMTIANIRSADSADASASASSHIPPPPVPPPSVVPPQPERRK